MHKDVPDRIGGVMENYKENPMALIGKLCECPQGKVGVVHSYYNGVWKGTTPDGGNWQSKHPVEVRDEGNN